MFTAPAAVVKDVELVDAPSDSISCMSFCPTGDYLAVGSWNHEVGSRTRPTRSASESEIFLVLVWFWVWIGPGV
jgi:hypothetical protein